MADVSALERALTPAALASEFSHDIATAPLAVVDTNLSPAALQVGKHCKPSQACKGASSEPSKPGGIALNTNLQGARQLS